MIVNICENYLDDFFALVKNINNPNATKPENKRQYKGISSKTKNDFAAIPVVGSLVDRYAGIWEEYGFCTSYESICEKLDYAIENGYSKIILDFDSPGGYAIGIDQVVDKIKSIKSKNNATNIVANVHNLCCSAAYEIACCCDKIYTPASATVGCIGSVVYMIDSSEAFKKEGLKAIVVSSGKYKGMGFEGTEITDEQIKLIQEEVDYHAGYFKNVVQTGRNLNDEQIEAVSTGQTWTGKNAKKLGLVDGICNFDSLLKQVDKDFKKMADEKETKNEAPEKVVASIVDLDTVFKNASAEFKLECLRNECSIEQAKDAYITTLENEIHALKNAKPIENPVPEQKPAPTENASKEVHIPGNKKGVDVTFEQTNNTKSAYEVAYERACKMLADKKANSMNEAFKIVFEEDSELRNKIEEEN